MNRASSATGWVRNLTMKSPDLDPHLASSYELGWTWNPITGCRNRTPEGLCLGGMFPCYAFKRANGRLRKRYLANDNIANPIATGTRDEIEEEAMEKLSDPFYPRFWEGRLDAPLFRSKHVGIFVCDMGELFGDWIPIQWQRLIFWTINSCPRHRFYLLTKQPHNLAKFSPFPENCWVGVTVTNNEMLSPALERLRFIEASIKYISFEPLLGGITGYDGCGLSYLLEDSGINWLILGSQTKPYRPPEIESVQEIVSAADLAGIPVFLKHNLWGLLWNQAWEDDIFWVNERGAKATLRQEMPK